MEKYFLIFDEFLHGSTNKLTFAGKDGEFLIYVFCFSDNFDLRAEIDRLSCIARKYSVP